MLRRGRRRRTELVKFVGAVVVEGVDVEQVWDFLTGAESAALVFGDDAHGYVEPGTGPGVGEVQCFVHRVGGSEHVHRVRVTHLDRPHVLVVSQLEQGVPWRTRYDVEARPDGVLLTETWGAALAPGLRLTEDRDLQAELDASLARVRELLTRPGSH